MSVLSLVLTCCLLGAVIFLAVKVSHLQLSVNQLDEKTDGMLGVNTTNLRHKSNVRANTTNTKGDVRPSDVDEDLDFGIIRPYTRRWRKDLQCGKQYPMEDGSPAECDPDSYHPCCSLHGWCDRTPKHCECTGCIDFRKGPI
ncbi:uncharacterized protein LOC118423578 [Branchiostoma floridae]|uniref:Uncharacterized protein LOC118423578 n=1 Tax=Branchiostoma floridae TaxID=7739 RepID=A0A9J7MZZ2_BRAFL|nr:uncharacterized protein LOC118423578 [Branchiostoma floridae]